MLSLKSGLIIDHHINSVATYWVLRFAMVLKTCTKLCV